MSSPAGDFVSLQERQQRLLGLLVPLPSDEGHDFGALLSGPNVHQPEIPTLASLLVNKRFEPREEAKEAFLDHKSDCFWP